VSTTKTSTPDFEQSLAELESVVERLEHGELPLEEALAQFERGIALARSCQDALKQAEQKVEILLARSTQAEAVPFEPDEPED
jgi:exodeoxyribonuclease VII small subunit